MLLPMSLYFADEFANDVVNRTHVVGGKAGEPRCRVRCDVILSRGEKEMSGGLEKFFYQNLV